MATAETVDRQLRRSSIVAGVGDGIAAVALPLIAVRASNGDPLRVASVFAVQHLPWILVQLSGRTRSFDRRTLVGLTDTARALALGVLAALVVRNKETMLVLLVAAFLVGLGEAWTDRLEADAGAAGKVGPRGMLAIGLVGFPLGGFLYDMVSGPSTPLFVDVLVFTVASTFALAVRGPVKGAPAPVPDGPEPQAPSPVDRTTGRPAGGLLGSRLPGAVLPLLGAATSASLAASGYLGLLVLFATGDLGLGAPAFGGLLAGLAASTAVGGFVAPSVGEWLGVRAGLVLGYITAGAGLAVASVVADPERPWQAAVALGVSAAGAMTATVLVRARLQLVLGTKAVPPVLDRLHLATWSAIPVGALVAGWAARQTPVHRVLVALAVVWVVSAVAVIAGDRASAGAGSLTLDRTLREIV